MRDWGNDHDASGRIVRGVERGVDLRPPGGLDRFGAGGVVSLETDGVYRVNGAF